MLARAIRNEKRIMTGVHDTLQSRQNGLLAYRCPTFAALVIMLPQRNKVDILILQKAQSLIRRQNGILSV